MANCITRNIPNTITCCNLVSGCVATYCALYSDIEAAFLFIVVGAVFDFFDGMSARLLGVSSPIGKELDSLADCITFGFAPSAIVCHSIGIADCPQWMPELLAGILPFVAFVMAAFSALRLAKFNLDTRQTTSFIGLPTPANALFWASLTVGLGFDLPVWAILVLEAVMCWLLVSEVPMFALKFKHWGWRGNEVKYLFVAVSAALLALCGLLGFALVIVVYIVLSVALDLRKQPKA